MLVFRANRNFEIPQASRSACSCSYSAGGTSPRLSCRRALLNQPTGGEFEASPTDPTEASTAWSSRAWLRPNISSSEAQISTGSDSCWLRLSGAPDDKRRWPQLSRQSVRSRPLAFPPSRSSRSAAAVQRSGRSRAVRGQHAKRDTARAPIADSSSARPSPRRLRAG